MTAFRMLPHHLVFVQAHGTGPWPCSFCGELVVAGGKGKWAIHHKDGNHDNNEVDNLAAAHPLCHNRHHHLGRKRPDSTRKKMSDSAKNRKKTPAVEEGIERMRQSKTGKKLTSEQLAARRAGMAQRGTNFRKSWMEEA